MISTTDAMIEAILACPESRAAFNDIMLLHTDSREQAQAVKKYCELRLLHKGIVLNRIQNALLQEVFKNVFWDSVMAALKQEYGFRLKPERFTVPEEKPVEFVLQSDDSDDKPNVICL